MSLSGLWTALTENRVETRPDHPDPRLRGRTYAIPFGRVWKAARELADGELRGWTLLEADEDRGRLVAEVRTRLFRFVDDVTISISLDENAQTRVDMTSASRVGKGDLGTNARRVRRFFRVLDRRIEAGPETILDPGTSLSGGSLPGGSQPGGSLPGSLALLALLPLPPLLAACTPAEELQETGEILEEEVPSPTRNFSGRVYERDIVFLTARGDSALIVPWSFRSRTRPGGVDREIRSWLGRGDGWDAFLAESWETPPSRVPWRILPRGPARLIVGPGDALERIFYQEGPRRLEVVLGDLLIEWTGQRAQTFRIHRGTLLLSDRSAQGFILDLSRARASDDPAPGSWAVLISGDSLQLVLEAGEQGEAGGEELYRGWARLDFTERRWRGLQLLWEDDRPFEPARRNVPVSWHLVSPGGDLQGHLDAVNPHLEVREGEGPVLPVDGLIPVTGSLVVEEREFPVFGFLRHREG